MKKFLLIVLALAAVLVGYLATQGLFRSVDVQQGEQGGFILLGKDHVGPYAEVGKVYEEFYALYPEGDFAGIYYDDPDEVPHDSLRAFVGIKVSASEGLDQIAQHPTMRMLTVDRRPAHYIDWDASLGSMVGMIIGTMKCYPALGEACEASGWSGEEVLAYEEYTDAGIRFVMQY